MPPALCKQRPAALPAIPPAPTCPQHERRVPHRPGNVYGDDRYPVEQVKEIERKSRWHDIIREPGLSNWLKPQMPGNLPGTPIAPPAHTPMPPTTSDSEDDIEWLCREGEADLAAFLMSKAIPIKAVSAETKPIREWTYRDILKLPTAAQEEWKAACRHELDILRERKVYELVDPPKGRKVIDNRWVFDVKPDGHKRTHLVAKGFSQVEGVDFDKIFSPVVRFETVRLMLALTALENWHIESLNVHSAYLYGKLTEEIYMKQPKGFRVPGQEHKVLRLLRALYGLKQVGLTWWETLNLVSSSNGRKAQTL